jgi:DNA invertase Pin-like site-specific DNA recombinase
MAPDATDAVYIRVSTVEQGDGYSLDSQTQRGIALAKALAEKSGQVPAWTVYQDKDSGSYAQRADFVRMTNAAKMGRHRRVITLEPDRFARELVTQESIIDDLQTHGVAVHFVKHDFDDTPVGTYMRQNLGALAQMQRGHTKEKMMDSFRTKAASGKNPTGRPPFGYRFVDADRPTPRTFNRLGRVVALDRLWEVDPLDGPTVERIAAWYDTPGPAWGVRRIVREVMAAGLAAPGGRRWHHLSVVRILRNERYTGTVHWGKTRKVKAPKDSGRKHDRVNVPREEWATIPAEHFPVPVLIPRDQWERIQVRLDKEAKKAKDGQRDGRTPKDVALLRNIGHCACGRAFSVRRNGAYKIPYYLCNSHQDAGDTPCTECPRYGWKVAVVDAAVFAAVEAFYADPARALAGLTAEAAEARRPHITPEKTLRKRLDATNGKMLRLVRLYTDGDLDHATLNTRKAEIEQERAGLVAQLAAYTPAPEAKTLDPDRLKRDAARVKGLADTPQARADVMRDLVTDCVLNRTHAHIRLGYKDPSNDMPEVEPIPRWWCHFREGSGPQYSPLVNGFILPPVPLLGRAPVGV